MKEIRVSLDYWPATKLTPHEIETEMLSPRHWLSLVDWISDTLSQGYTNLQSLVKCLDHRGVPPDTLCSQARLC